MDFDIARTWDNKPVTHDPVHLTLTSDPAGLHLAVAAPFFRSPPSPPLPPGPCPQLWDYEVVEAFFMNDKDQYLEVELCPHGHHLVLVLNGRRNIVQEQLALAYDCEIQGNGWRGRAVIPASYLPPSPTRFNAFAIHGDGDKRVYEALYPATSDEHSMPDFHRLEYFQPINLGIVSPFLIKAEPSEVWKQYPTP